MDKKEDQRNEVHCGCSKQCGNTFKVPEKTLERAKAQGDILISLSCPDIESYTFSIIESLKGFAVVYSLGKSS
jgi:hypothetical protein